MPDLADLLDRTTPRGLVAPDLAEIARRADRRRRNRRRAPVVAVAVVAVVSAVAAVAGGLGDGPAADTDDVASFANPFGGDRPLAAPVGTWRPAAAPPFGPRSPSITGSLSDGRVLVWGAQGGDPGAGPLDGGVYDPATDGWEPIVAAPVADGAVVQFVALAGDRLLFTAAVLVDGEEVGDWVGAVYDANSRTWTELPSMAEVAPTIGALAWNGDDLAVLESAATDDGRSYEPRILRWRFGDDRWTDGAAWPLGPRSLVAYAADGQRLAVVGGTTTPPDSLRPGPDPGVVRDGAIYDVAADTWTSIPDAPQAAMTGIEAAWLADGRLVVSGGADDWFAGLPWRPVAVAYDPATGTWSELPPVPAPDGTPISTASWLRFDAGAPVLLTANREYVSGPHPRPLYASMGWEEAPLNDLRVVGPVIVATGANNVDPGDGPFQVAVRTGPGVWLPAAEAPFGNRIDVGMATIGDDSLFVIGGRQGAESEQVGDAWILDLNP